MSQVARCGLCVISCLISCVIAVVATAQVLPDALQACKREADDARRLQCYDREAARFPLIAVQSFGLNKSQVAAAQHQTSAAVAAVTKVTAKVVAIRERAHAGFVITLDNGQVWSQNEMDATRGIAVGDTVTLQPARLAGIWLVGPSGWSTKVRRVQ